MKSWLRGGIIGAIFIGILFLIMPMFSQKYVILPILFFFGENPYDILSMIMFLAIYFIIGAVIGFLIGKLGGRRK